MLEDLRSLVVAEELDYPLLMNYLGGYSKPRDKLTRWLKSGAIIRVKKGLYVFGKKIIEALYVCLSR